MSDSKTGKVTDVDDVDVAVTDLTEPEKPPVYKVGDQVLNAWGQRVQDLPEEEQENVGEVDGDASPYEGWKKAELVQEVKNRNEGRSDDDRISTEGTAQDLIARLEEDDESGE